MEPESAFTFLSAKQEAIMLGRWQYLKRLHARAYSGTTVWALGPSTVSGVTLTSATFTPTSEQYITIKINISWCLAVKDESPKPSITSLVLLRELFLVAGKARKAQKHQKKPRSESPSGAFSPDVS